MAGGISGRSNRFNKVWQRHQPMAEINVTPMVDVMLVLLVVFMVTAPLLTVGIQVDLPKAKAGAISGEDEPLTVTVNKEGAIYLQETEMELDSLVPRLMAITNNNPDIRVFIRGDKTIDYGRVMQVMGTLNASGFNKVALITDRPGSQKKSKSKAKGSDKDKR